VEPSVPYDLTITDRSSSEHALVQGLVGGTGEHEVRLRERAAARFIEVVPLDPSGARIPDGSWSLVVRDLESGAVTGGSVGRADLNWRPFKIEVRAAPHMRGESSAIDPADAPARITVHVEPVATIPVQVSCQGEGVRDVLVCLVAAAERPRVWSACVAAGAPLTLEVEPRGFEAVGMTDALGQAVLELARTGRYFVRVTASGFADALHGPFELDLLVTEPLHLVIGRGGTLEGTVSRADGVDVAGTLVGVSNGDGSYRCQFVDEEGRFRFEDLAAGGWQVRTMKREPENAPLREDECTELPAGSAPPGWDVEVVEGQVVRFDIALDLRRSGNRR
jgi:hypothetical protein